MSWKHILKRVDYNDLDDKSKQEIKYSLIGRDYLEPTLNDFFGDFPIYDESATSSIKELDMGFPDYFELFAIGSMQLDEMFLITNVDVFIRNKRNKKESYYFGGFRGDESVKDVLEITGDLDIQTIEEQMLVPDFEHEKISRMFEGADYNKLVGYLKETNKWEEISHIEDKMMKLPKVSHSKEVDNWLEDAEDYASQNFEQSYSRDDESSIGTAQEFYKLLEYLRTNKETSWNEGDLKRKFPTAMLIVSETLGGLP